MVEKVGYLYTQPFGRIKASLLDEKVGYLYTHPFGRIKASNKAEVCLQCVYVRAKALLLFNSCFKIIPEQY